MKDIEGYRGVYAATEDGRIWSHPRAGSTKPGRFLRGQNSRKGYLLVSLCDARNNKPQKGYSVHRLIAHAFIPNPDNLPQVNHINCNKKDNRVENLEWCDQLANMKHAKENGLRPRGESFCISKLSERQVINIRRLSMQGMKYTEIAKIYDITPSHARRVAIKVMWKHI